MRTGVGEVSSIATPAVRMRYRSCMANGISPATCLTGSAAGRKIGAAGHVARFAASGMIRKAPIPNRGFLLHVTDFAGDGFPK